MTLSRAATAIRHAFRQLAEFGKDYQLTAPVLNSLFDSVNGKHYMGWVSHRSATTTHAVRAAIQRSQASNAPLSRDLEINPKPVAKWPKQTTLNI